MRIETFRNHGPWSRSSQYLLKNLLTEICGPGSGLQKFKRPQGLIICGQKFRPVCRTQRNERTSSNGLSKNQKLDMARKLGGVYFLIRMIRKGVRGNHFFLKKQGTCWNVPFRHRETCCESNENRKSKHACIVEAHESTRKLLERTLPKDHEDPIAENGFNSSSHYNIVHKFITLPHSRKIQDAKAAVAKKWEKLEKLPAWQLTKVKSKKRLCLKHRKSKEPSTLLR